MYGNGMNGAAGEQECLCAKLPINVTGGAVIVAIVFSDIFLS
jgi:hypothetical protein